MKIFYNLSGAARKALVTAITEELNMPAHYHGAPTFAYKVGGYQIDKTGMLEGADNRGLVADLLGLHDFKAIQEEYDMVPQAEEPVPDDLTITETTALGGQISPYDDEQEPHAYAQPESDTMVIEVPLTGFTPDILDNLIKLVKSKENLLRTALGVDNLPIQQTADTLRFPWFSLEASAQDHSDKVKTYTMLVEKMCAAVKLQKRVTAKEKPVENEKFAFRVFLIRLGFVGDEYKAARKFLLKNLSGNSAFKNGASKKVEPNA